MALFNPLTKLRKEINERNKKLHDLFEAKDAGKMAALFGQNLNLFDSEGRIIEPKNIEGYWQELIDDRNVTKVTFDLVVLVGHPLKLKAQAVTDGTFEHDYVAFEVTEYYYNDDQSTGGSIKYGCYMHRKNCPWG